jgi:hypothetical protein
MSRVKVQHVSGWYEVEGDDLGNGLLVHRNLYDDWWNVSHKASGAYLTSKIVFPTQRDARKFADVMAVWCDWDDLGDTYADAMDEGVAQYACGVAQRGRCAAHLPRRFLVSDGRPV